jgi:hypothetical protein
LNETQAAVFRPKIEGLAMKTFLAAAAVLFALAGPVSASQCPSLWAKAEEALKTASLDDAGKAKVVELVVKGKAEHEGGDHAASEATLMEALKLLGI